MAQEQQRDDDAQSGTDILAEQRQGAAWLTINRAHKHNALSRTVLSELAEAVKRIGNDTEIGLIVLAGAGDRYFAAGGDLVDLSNVRTESDVQAMTDQARNALDAIRRCPIPVIAFLNGDAIGGGAELALACDMRLQASHARIGYVQARLAITSAWGGGPDLCQLVGSSRAMRMMSRGELIDAELALQWGLAEALITDGAAGVDMQSYLKPMLACPRQVLVGIKAQTSAWRQRLSYDEHRAIEQQQLARTWLHEDHWRASENLLAKGKK